MEELDLNQRNELPTDMKLECDDFPIMLAQPVDLDNQEYEETKFSKENFTMLGMLAFLKVSWIILMLKFYTRYLKYSSKSYLSATNREIF